MPVFKGGKQGLLESALSLILDEALGPLLAEWQRKGCGVDLAMLTTDPQVPAPWSWVDAAGWITLLACADDLRLLAKSQKQIQQVHKD